MLWLLPEWSCCNDWNLLWSCLNDHGISARILWIDCLKSCCNCRLRLAAASTVITAGIIVAMIAARAVFTFRIIAVMIAVRSILSTRYVIEKVLLQKKHIIKCVCDHIWSRVFNFEKGEKLKILKSEEFVAINFNNKFVTD